ncbi:MAG: hypothetical protein COA79_13050 [Planctomycetota bacterium]|nr:MAG: hypothetical protein COA79_13050 [Planctomycetota bacterium]
MNSIKQTYKYSTLLIISFVLFSCGSGGSDSSDNGSNPIPPTNGEPTSGNNKTLAPEILPTFQNGTFLYTENNQKFESENLTTSNSIFTAVFRNSASTNETEDLNIADENFNDSTTSTETTSAKQLKTYIEKNHRCGSYKKDNLKAPYLYSKRNGKSKNKHKKKNRIDDAIGTRDTFFHDEGPDNGKVLDFELLYKSSKCLIYSEINTSTNLPYVSQSRGSEIGVVFSTNNPYHKDGEPIFDTVTKTFGNPWGIDSSGNKINNGGRDEEAPVLIILFNSGSSTNLFGYFYWVDEEEKGYVNSDGYISNGAEIIFLNQHYADDDINLFSTLSHEFQHLCDYNQKFVLNGDFTTTITYQASYDEDTPTMFNEGKSMLCEDLCGFSLDVTENGGGKGNKFMFNMINTYRNTLSINSKSFLNWNGGSDYGKGYLFWRYIYDSYGSDILKKAATDKSLPPESLEVATSKNFDILLQEFLIALIQTESKNSSSVYKITSLDITKDYKDTNGNSLGKLLPLSFIDGIPNSKISNKNPYEIRLYKLLPKNGKVNFTIDNIKEESSFSIFTTVIDE